MDVVLQPELGRWVGVVTDWVLGFAVKHLLSVAVTRHHPGSVAKRRMRENPGTLEPRDWEGSFLSP